MTTLLLLFGFFVSVIALMTLVYCGGLLAVTLLMRWYRRAQP